MNAIRKLDSAQTIHSEERLGLKVFVTFGEEGDGLEAFEGGTIGLGD